MNKLNIIFAGSALFSLKNIEYINKINIYNISYILIKKIKLNNSKEIKLIKRFAYNNNIKIFETNSLLKDSENILNIIKKYNINILISSYFGLKFPNVILNYILCINIHASILPEFVGPSPIHWTLLNYKNKSGITIIKMNENIDFGEIIFRSSFKIKKHENYNNLYTKLYKFSSYAILYILRTIYINGIFIKRDLYKNIIIKKSYTKKINKNFYKIIFNFNIIKIDKIIRTFVNLNYFILNDIKYKIISHEYIYNKKINNNLGKVILINKHGIYIRCLFGILVIKKIQFPNKNPINIKDLINSNKINIFYK